MKNMNWTIDQAMNALEVPEDKREKYLQSFFICDKLTVNNTRS